MSKLFLLYGNLKKEEPNTLFLFKSGIFFIAIDKDAISLSKLLNLKLTNLNNTILKCGFPCSSLDKYLVLLKAHNINVKIIDTTKNTTYFLNEYQENKNIKELLDFINNIDINNLSVSEAYNLLEDIKNKVKQI